MLTCVPQLAFEDPKRSVAYCREAASLRLSTVQLSAQFSHADPNARPVIWLKAADGANKPQRFVSSRSVGARNGSELRIKLRVPPGSRTLSYGLLFGGMGAASIESLYLEDDCEPLDGGDASAYEVYQHALQLVADHAYFANLIAPEELETTAYLSNAPGTGYQAAGPIRSLVQRLGDRHSFHISAEDDWAYREFGSNHEQAKVSRIPDGIGYVSIPGFRDSNFKRCSAFALPTLEAIQEINADSITGWVVDLRNNSGGNLWPMASALSPLLGEGVCGGFKDTRGNVSWWSANSLCSISAESRRVAVLVGSRTCSSGEILASALSQMPNTRLFGKPTAGRLSSNRKYSLPDGSALFITSAVCVDRNGNQVGPQILPEVLLDDSDSLFAVVPELAKRWLVEDCRGN